MSQDLESIVSIPDLMSDIAKPFKHRKPEQVALDLCCLALLTGCDCNSSNMYFCKHSSHIIDGT